MIKTANCLDYVFFNGKFVGKQNAKVGVLTHALHYGTACFEGIYGVWNGSTIQFFRMRDHYNRFLNNCHTLDMCPKYTLEQLCDITNKLVIKNAVTDNIYIRALGYKSTESIGTRLHDLEDGIAIVVIILPPTLKQDGVRCCISSWRRISNSMLPMSCKICGWYVNNAIAKTEAYKLGFDDAIMLTNDGYVSEASSTNIFILSKQELITPSIADDIFPGITRDTIIKIAHREFNMNTIERHICRDELYQADECFLTGTAAHVVPVLGIDHRHIGNGKPGCMTRKFQEIYSKLLAKGDDWLADIGGGE